VKTFLSLAGSYVELDDASVERARKLLPFGFRGIDALHIAMAEKGTADFFVTCDDGIA